MMFIEVNGVSLYYEVCGSGPPLILVHGNGEDHSIFDRGVFFLKESFTVYSVDSRGHGRSSDVDEFHYDDMAEDMVQFIASLGLERPAFFGFSDGGIIGLLLASRHPDMLSRLYVAGANTSPGELKGLGMMICRIRNRISKDPKITMMLREPHITAEDLGRITVPVTVMAGDRDCVRRRDTEFIAGGVKDGRVLIMPDSDHCSYVTDSTEFLEPILSDLLEAVSLSDP